MSAITLYLPDDLAGLIAKYEDQLPEIVEQGIRRLERGTPPFDPKKYEDTEELFEFLVAFPSPEEVMELKASERLQQRVSDLLEKNRNEGLTSSEEEEMDHYESVQHLVTMAKIKAAAKLGLGSAPRA